MADGLAPAAVPQEASASRGTSPGPGPGPGPRTVSAGPTSEGVANGGAGDAPVASCVGGAEAAMKLMLPLDAGEGSASDTWESPDLPPHLAKLGLRWYTTPAAYYAC